MYKHILIATDGSELAQKATDQGIALAKAVGAKVTAIHVTLPWTAVAVGEVAIALPPENYDKMTAEHAATILKAVSETATQAGIACNTRHVENRSPAEGIIDIANETDVDLIVMSSHGRSGFARLLLGSETAKVVSHSRIPVLICR